MIRDADIRVLLSGSTARNGGELAETPLRHVLCLEVRALPAAEAWAAGGAWKTAPVRT